MIIVVIIKNVDIVSGVLDASAGGPLHAGQRVRSADAVQQVHRQLRLRSQVFLKTINKLFIRL